MKAILNNMTVHIMKDYDDLSQKAADFVEAQLLFKSNSVLGLATGSSPEGMYQALVERYRDHEIDFKEVITFNLDEYYQLDPHNEQSYSYYMHSKFFNHVNIPEDHIYLPNGNATSLEVFCKTYDDYIFNKYPIDLQILGIGNNGHIGFNEPDVQFEMGTHLVELDESTIEANSRFFESKEDVPRKAVSMGIKNIMRSKKILLVANGRNKAEIINQMIFGPVTPEVPASILQLHNDVTIIVDKAAASVIGKKIRVESI